MMSDNPHQEGTRKNQTAQSASVTYLEPALWQQLTEATSDREFCLSWLRLQCRMIEEVYQGMVLLGPAEAGPFLPVASWPEQSAAPEIFDALVQRVVREGKGVVVRYQAELAEAAPDRYHLGYPVKLDQRLHGVVILDIGHRQPEGLQSVLRQLQWGCAWLEKHLLRKQVAPVESAQQQLIQTLDMTAIALQEEHFRGASMTSVTELATRLVCDRVSIGFRRNAFVEVVALSHSAQFGKQMNLMRAIGHAMDECFDQGRPILYPPAEASLNTVTRAHRELANQHASAAILSIPLFTSGGAGCGALVFERGSGPAFSIREMELCTAIAAILGPILEEKRRNDRSLAARLQDAWTLRLAQLAGPGHLGSKLAVACLLAVVIFLAFAVGDYRVTAKTQLEGEVQRAVTVPFDGYVDEALVRAGDLVTKGQLMATLNDKDLLLERLKWASMQEQSQLEYYKALAEFNHAAANVYQEQANQAAAELRLIDHKLSRARLSAPFDGVVVSGDLSQSLDAPVARGDVLFEVAPLDSYRVILEVDERDIGAVRAGQQGLLKLNAMPDQELGFSVEKITPVSTASEGLNYFRVEARLQEPSPRLRPGMEGYGKIEAERRRLIWIWTHELMNWVRLWAWKWLP